MTIVGRYARVCDIQPAAKGEVRYEEGAAFDTATLAAGSLPVERNSVLLLPSLLTASECATLIADVEALHARQPAQAEDSGLQRYMLCELGADSQALFDDILRMRLLPFVSRELPLVEEMIWARSHVEQPRGGVALDGLRYKFSTQEPAVNRYAAKGHFEQHRDSFALTLNVLLRGGDGTHFTGGGTQFWREGGDADGPPTLRIEPAAGAGVVFNGTVQHAGKAVTDGVRHVLVASFSIWAGSKLRWSSK